tara:strand:- start:661 stop:2070 length:1410 start_codon:yes stop_codon:yes gene_type:complete
MATLLEFQELLRNVSEPEVAHLLQNGPSETRWMVMDEKRRRAEMRKAEEAMLSESQMSPRNMLEEYQATTASVLGGQAIGSMGQPDQGQYGGSEPSGGLDPYAGQQDEAIGFSPGGLVPIASALGRTAAASSIPWIAKLAQKLGARAVPQAPGAAATAAQSAGRLPAGWTIGPHGVPIPPHGGVPGPAGRLSPPHPGDPVITTPFGQIPGRGVNLPSGPTPGTGARPIPSGGPPVPAKTVAETAEAATKGNLITRHPYIAGGAGLLAANYMMGDDDEGSSSMHNLGAPLQQQGAPSGTSAYRKILEDSIARNDAFQERIGDSRVSTKDKVRRVGLKWAEAMMTTPGPFGNAVGAGFGAIGDELGAISQEEDEMLRTAIAEYQAGSRSIRDLLEVIALVDKSMQGRGAGRLTDTQLMKYHSENPDDVNNAGFGDTLRKLDEMRRMMDGGGGPSTDFDHSTLASSRGTPRE